MSAEATPEGGDRRQRPPVWVLCSLYIVAVALLCAAGMLALDLLWWSLAKKGVIDEESTLVTILATIASMSAIIAFVVLVFFSFRALFKLTPTSPADEGRNSFRITCLVLVAYFLFFLVYVLLARQLGIKKEQLAPDIVGPLVGFLFFARWPLWNLLNPDGVPAREAEDAPVSDSSDPA